MNTQISYPCLAVNSSIAQLLLWTCAAKPRIHTYIFVVPLKLRIFEGYNSAKAIWKAAPKNWGSQEIPSPPPRKSCADKPSRGWPPRFGRAIDGRPCLFTGVQTTSAGFAGGHILLHCNGDRVVAARNLKDAALPASGSYSRAHGQSRSAYGDRLPRPS